MRSGLPGRYTVLSKTGWINEPGYVAQNDCGIVIADGHPYLCICMTGAFDRYSDLREFARAMDGVHKEMVKDM